MYLPGRVWSAVLLLLVACGDSSSANSDSATGSGGGSSSTGACMIGFAGCACSEGLCLSGLECIDQLCVDPGVPTTGATGSASDGLSAGTSHGSTATSTTDNPVTAVTADPSTTTATTATNTNGDTQEPASTTSASDSEANPCGNGIADGDEACDGPDLKGKTCPDLGLMFGQLACTNACELDKSGCTDSAACGDGIIVQNKLCYQPAELFGDTPGLDSVVLGDVNGDSHVDMVAGTPNQGVWIRFGAGDGSFAAQTVHVAQPPQIDVDHLIDLDKDGDLDLVGNDNPQQIHILHNDGAGNLTLNVSYDTLQYALYTAFADVDDDGWYDMAVCGEDDTDAVGFRHGQIGGEFGPLITYPIGPKLGAVRCGFIDFDADGFVDLWAVSGTLAAEFRVLHGDGAGHFELDPAKIGFVARSFAGAADLNDDGHVDVVGNTDSDKKLLVRHGDGNFLEAMLYSFAINHFFARSGNFGNFDGNNILDVAIHTRYGPELFRGDGTGLFYDGVFLDGDDGLEEAALGDLNEDGLDDIVSVHVLPNDYFQRVFLSDP